MTGLVSIIMLTAAAAAMQSGPLPVDGFVETAAAPETQSVQAETDREKRLTIPVNIEGKGPFRFLIDTGSQRTVASSSLAEDLDLAIGPAVRIVGVAGTVEAHTAHASEIRLGSRSLQNMTMPIFERRHIGADGILGTDSLQGQRVLIDFKQDRIEIGDSRQLGGNSGYEIIVRARRRSGQLIVTNARLDGISLPVILDTGAGTSVGNRALQKALAKKRGTGAIITLRSVTGQTTSAEIGFARRLDIRDISITNLIIAFTDTPAFTALGLEKKPALFLGMRELRLFKRVAIDFRKRNVLFDLPDD